MIKARAADTGRCSMGPTSPVLVLKAAFASTKDEPEVRLVAEEGQELLGLRLVHPVQKRHEHHGRHVEGHVS